jgi:hypothetical protein
VPALARWCLGADIVATICANVAHGLGHGPVGALVSAWPALVLAGSFELLMILIRSEHQAATEHSPGITRRANPGADGTGLAPSRYQPAHEKPPDRPSPLPMIHTNGKGEGSWPPRANSLPTPTPTLGRVIAHWTVPFSRSAARPWSPAAGQWLPRGLQPGILRQGQAGPGVRARPVGSTWRVQNFVAAGLTAKGPQGSKASDADADLLVRHGSRGLSLPWARRSARKMGQASVQADPGQPTMDTRWTQTA